MPDPPSLLAELLETASGRVGDVLDRLPAMVGVFRGPDLVIEYANPGYRALLPGVAYAGRPVAEVFDQPANRPFVDALRRAFTTGEPQSGREWRGVVPDPGTGEPTERWFDFTFLPLPRPGGDPGGVLLHAVEVTGLVRAGRAARESERRFRLLVDSPVVGVTIASADRMVEANDAFLAMVGHDRAALEAGRVSWRAMTPPEWREVDDAALARLRADGWTEPFEKEYLRADGTRVPVLISALRLDAEPFRAVALIVDLSERNEALAREREARRRAERAAARTARLQRVTAALSAAATADDVRTAVVEQAMAAFGATAGALAFRRGDAIHVDHPSGFDPVGLDPWRRVPVERRTPVVDVLGTGRPVLLGSPEDWAAYPGVEGGPYAAMAVLPLAFAGTVLGALVLCDERPRRFSSGDRAFLTALADQAAQALERSRLYEERAYVARTLQAGLLPERLADAPGLEVAVRYHSIADGGAVGGDFYDFFATGPDRWLVAVGDVAGKGTAAAVLTGLARHTLRAIALREERVEDMLRFLNEALRQQSAASAFCTVGCATLTRTPSGFDACLASGGHPAPLVVRAGGAVEEPAVRGTLLGVEPDPALEEVPLSLGPGDLLVFYTDGMTDAADDAGVRFGDARLRAAVQAAAGGPADAVATAVDGAVAAYEGGRRRDDRALVVLRVRP